jgi:hypothetical protein
MVAVPPELVPGLAADDADPTPLRVPSVAPWLPHIPVPRPAQLHQLQDDLDRSGTGRALISFWLRHQTELTALVQRNRRVAVVWHRNGGPALMQLLTRMLSRPALALPRTVCGTPLPSALHRIAVTFARHSSDALRADLEALLPTLPRLSGLTYPQIIDRLGTD